MVYKWAHGAHHPKIAAQVVGQRLASIRKKNKSLTAMAVVNDARPKDSPLHCCFEWNSLRAADAYRLDQARHLIRSVTVVVADAKGSDRSVRGFVHVTVNDKPQYVPVGVAMADTGMRNEALADALRELESWRERYRNLQELADILAAADEALERFSSARVDSGHANSVVA